MSKRSYHRATILLTENILMASKNKWEIAVVRVLVLMEEACRWVKGVPMKSGELYFL